MIPQKLNDSRCTCRYYVGILIFFCKKLKDSSKTRTHLTWFRCLNEFLSPDFGYCTDSYILIQYVSKIYVQPIRSTYVLYDKKYLRTYFMTILLRRNCTSSYKSDKIERFAALVRILEIYKMLNKLVKNYIQTNFESVNLFKQPRGTKKCNEKGCSTDSSTRYGFRRKFLMNRSGVF